MCAVKAEQLKIPLNSLTHEPRAWTGDRNMPTVPCVSRGQGRGGGIKRGGSNGRFTVKAIHFYFRFSASEATYVRQRAAANGIGSR